MNKVKHTSPQIHIKINSDYKVEILSSHVTSTSESTNISTVNRIEAKMNEIYYVINLLNKKAEFEINLIVSGHFIDHNIEVGATGLGMKTRHRPTKLDVFMSKYAIVASLLIVGMTLMVFFTSKLMKAIREIEAWGKKSS